MKMVCPYQHNWRNMKPICLTIGDINCCHLSRVIFARFLYYMLTLAQCQLLTPAVTQIDIDHFSFVSLKVETVKNFQTFFNIAVTI